MKQFNCVPCFVCGKELESAFGDLECDTNQPSYGVAFDTTGNYGSAFFDSVDNDHRIEIAICDECLKTNKHRIRESVWHRTVIRTTVQDNL